MTHIPGRFTSRLTRRKIRATLERLESRMACAVDIAPAVALVGEVGSEEGATGRPDDPVVTICAPFESGAFEGTESGGTGGAEPNGDDTLLTVTMMPFGVTMMNERSRPARVPPVRGGLAQALSLRGSVVTPRVESLPAIAIQPTAATQQAMAAQQDLGSRAATTRPQSVLPGRFVRQITARIDRLSFARLGR